MTKVLRELVCSRRDVARTSVQGFLDLHVPKTTKLLYCGSLCAGPQKRRLPWPDQPDRRPDPNPIANPNPNPLGGPRSALEVDRGSIELTCKSENLARTYVKFYARGGNNNNNNNLTTTTTTTTKPKQQLQQQQRCIIPTYSLLQPLTGAEDCRDAHGVRRVLNIKDGGARPHLAVENDPHPNRSGLPGSGTGARGERRAYGGQTKADLNAGVPGRVAPRYHQDPRRAQ